MNYQVFIEEIKEQLQKKLSICKIDIIDVPKNNGVILKGVRIMRKDCPVSPLIYLEQYFARYQAGEEIGMLIADIVDCYQYSKINKPMQVDKYLVFDDVKERIVYKLINYEKNKTLLEEIPHVQFLDLAIVFYYICENSEPIQATILIRNTHLQMWNQTKENIFAIAIKNAPKQLKVCLRGMHAVIKDMLRQEEMKEEILYHLDSKREQDDMYVLTNQKGIFGAACMLYYNVLESFSKRIKKDFYILPSSIHEVILVPKQEEMEAKKLKKMVKEVNESEVSEEEILSNNVYFYSFENQKFTIA